MTKDKTLNEYAKELADLIHGSIGAVTPAGAVVRYVDPRPGSHEIMTITLPGPAVPRWQSTCRGLIDIIQPCNWPTNPK